MAMLLILTLDRAVVVRAFEEMGEGILYEDVYIMRTGINVYNSAINNFCSHYFRFLYALSPPTPAPQVAATAPVDAVSLPALSGPVEVKHG